MTRASWLTPAPYPEPDEPTAPGALVRDGAGRYLTRGGMAAGRWYGPNVQGYTWDFIQRPVTVVLADPAEVETLRDEVKAWCHAEALRAKQRDEAQSERDELQRRIGTATAYAYGQQAKGEFISSSRLDSILRGES
jgi:hypothetical protein